MSTPAQSLGTPRGGVCSRGPRGCDPQHARLFASKRLSAPHHLRRRLKLGLALLILVALSLGVCATGAQPASAGANTKVYFDDGSGEQLQHAVFTGFGRQIVISGSLTREDPVEDRIYAQADVYIAPHGAVTADGQALHDISGWLPNTIIAMASGDSFYEETIGFVGVGGLTGSQGGRYRNADGSIVYGFDVVVDEDQNGEYDAGTDYVLGAAPEHPDNRPAFEVDERGIALNSSEVEQLKGVSFAAAPPLLALGASIWGLDTFDDAVTLLWEHAVKQFVIDQTLKIGFLDPIGVSHALTWGQGKHYYAIYMDPPDEQYASEVLLAPGTEDIRSGGNAVERSAASLSESLEVEGRISAAFLSALERYQGASAAGDGYWCLRHGQALQDYAQLTAERSSISAVRLRSLASAVAGSDVDIVHVAQEVRDLQTNITQCGLSDNLRTVLSAMGLSTEEITSAQADFLAIDSNVDKASILQAFEGAAAAEQDAASAYAGFAAGLQPLIDQLSISAPDEGVFLPPIATLAGPFRDTAPCSMGFDASASSDPNNGSLSFAWDLDDDGVFDDAAGPIVTRSFDAPEEGMVAVRVTNTAGRSRVAYAPLTIAAGAAPPSFTLTRPSSPGLDLTVGASAEFQAAADAAGAPASLSWFLDGQPVGVGASCIYGPTAADRGLRYVTVVAAGPGGASSTRTWTVAVHDPVVLKVEPSITSAAALAIGSAGATVRVTFELGDYSSADLSVQYREQGSAQWLTSPSQTQRVSGTVDAQVDGLHPGTTYEYRPVLSYADGSEHATTALFTTPVLQIVVSPVSSQSKVYGQLDPLLTYTSIPVPLGTDTFSGRLARAVGEDVGTYAVTKGSLQLPGRYELKFTEGVTFAITPASTGTAVSADGTSIYAGGSVTLTAEVTPANVGSPLTGTVAFTINGTPYGTSAVSPVAGSPNGAVQASVTVPIDKASELPAAGGSDFPVVASFTSTNTNYQGSVSAASTLRVMQTPAAAGARTFSVDGDFEVGTLMGVEHKPVHDQLQLSQKTTAFPYIWIPNFDGTISKVNTETGAELGRYKTGPGNSDPSRTTVDLEGSCYTGNRRLGSAVKVGLPEMGNWIDRNHNGVCDTSRDTNGDGYISGDEILPWGQDEAVLYELVLVAGYEGAYVPGTYTGPYDTDYYGTAPRAFAVDPGNDVWVGSFSRQMYFHIDGATGAIMTTLKLPLWGPQVHRPYGAVLDDDGILWSVHNQDWYAWSVQHVLAINTSNLSDMTRIDLPIPWQGTPGAGAYGIALDHSGHVFVTGGNLNLTKIDRATRSIVWTKSIPGADTLKGVVCTADDNVWLADTVANRVFRLDNDGNLIAAIGGLRGVKSYGDGVTGVAVDTAGKVWACDLNYDAIYRINPATNQVDLTKDILDSGGLYSHPGHYSYSDMTGIVARSITSKTGMWTVVHDSGSAGESWGTASWNASEPAGTAVRVKVRSSEDKAAWSAWEDASSGTPLTSIPDGRYLQLQVTLQIASGKTSPILYDLTVQPASQPPENEAPTVVVGGPSVSVAEGQVAAASGTWGDPDGDPVSLSASVGTVVKNAAGTWSWSYATTDGPADSQKVTITADDGKGGTASAQFQLVVANVAPSVSAGPARTIVAGETYTGAGSFADPGADSPWTATVDYGDGAGPVSLTVAADKAFALSHVYAATGGYAITVKVTDKDGAAGTATASVTVNPPANRPPALTVIGPLVSANEGQTATNSGTWNDPDGDVVTLSASVGTVVKNAAGTWSWSYATRDGTAESQTVTLTADDGRGGISTASFALAVLNVAPSVTVPASSSVPEGSPFSASGSFSDPGADTWTATVDYGDGSGVQTLPLKGDRTFALLHEYVGNGDYTITVKVSDDDGGVGSGVAAVTVTNVSPSVSMPTAGSAAEGSQFAVAGCFSHPGAGSTCTATVDYGDGSGVQSLALGADKSFRLAHTYAQNGAYAAKVRVTDKDGASGTAQVTVNVANVAPSVGPISAPADPVGTAVVVSCSSPFTDPGTSDTHTAVWSWGDGTASAGAVSEAAGSGNVTGSHTYAATGVYSVSLTVSDADGGSGTASYDFIVVYDPTSGFVTGGGWIASPAGANASKPAFAGKASFGFVSKYFKKATNPRGDTRFVLHGAAFDFKAKAYDSLTVAGALAQYAGSGTVNGAQGYGFLVSVLDGQAAGGGGTDKFRLKIWDAKTRAVIYDTQSGAADTAAPTTLLGGGSIVIHD